MLAERMVRENGLPMPTLEEYATEIKDLWESHHLTNMGPKHNELQQKLKEFLGVEHVELLANRYLAFKLTCEALYLSGEIISTLSVSDVGLLAILDAGLEPVFCDTKRETGTVDCRRIATLVTNKTSAIVVPHTRGHFCDVEEIERIANKHNLKVIYDATQAFGKNFKGKGIGCYGDASIFSFDLNTPLKMPEGAAVCFWDKEIEQRLYDLKNFGIHGEAVTAVGANAKMNEFSAAMGLCSLRLIKDSDFSFYSE